jgi:signal transduction histidine kinase
VRRTLALAAPVLALGILSVSAVVEHRPWGLVFAPLAFSCTAVGAMLWLRRANGVMAGLFLFSGIMTTVSVSAEAYAREAAARHLADASWVAWGFQATLSVSFLFFLILQFFPTGSPVTPRWRWLVAATVAVAGAGIAAAAFGVTAEFRVNFPAVRHPLTLLSASLTNLLDNVAGVGAALVFFASAVSVVVRYRRSRDDERQQMKWFTLAAAAAAVIFAIGVIGFPNGPANPFALSAPLIPIAAGVAILRYRLYDIDVVISKTVVYAALAAFITLVYVAVVVGLGAILGAHGESLPLSILATGVIAVAFQPVRDRMQRVANRLVFGERATPYEVLARFSERVAGTYATEDILPRTARVIAEGTGAERVEIWLKLGAELRPGAAWPADSAPAEPVPMDDGALPELPADRTLPVRLRDELLGAVTVSKPRGESLTRAEDRLLSDLAQQAGLVLANVRLTADLEARLDLISRQARELRASRQRIVAAQDEERRRLERNIHDGAQQHLVALAVKLRLAKSFLGKDSERAHAMLAELQEEVGEALDTLTALSLGIYPPLLEEQGLAAALAAQYQRSDLPVHMKVDGMSRYPIEVEAAIYFCVLEALQNSAKYAGATSISVTIAERDRGLSFEVGDDGAGFDGASVVRGSGLQNMHDRLSTLGGTLQVTATPGHGTSVVGWVPVYEPAGAKR